jgi:putative transposase
MRRLDELHLRYPFMGARMLRDQLNRQGIDIGRKHVSTLMKKININASLIRARNNQDTRFILIY